MSLMFHLFMPQEQLKSESMNKGVFLMKKLFFTILFMIIIVFIVFISYLKTYTVTENKKQLEDSVKQCADTTALPSDSIDIKQQLNLDNKKYIIFTVNNNLFGDAEFTKGFNNKYKIERTGWNNNYFKYGIYKTNKGKYLILKGDNYDMKISYAKVLLNNKEYKINIPQQEYYIAYCEVPYEAKSNHPHINNIKMYDANDAETSRP